LVSGFHCRSIQATHSSLPLFRHRNRFDDDGKRQDELERIVEQRKSAEPLVPPCRSLVLGITVTPYDFSNYSGLSGSRITPVANPPYTESD
jgi:hypothetical protein